MTQNKKASFTQYLINLSSSLNLLCWYIAGIIMVLMLGVVFLQVVSRYIFFSPPSWTEEFARYCMIWSGLLGSTVAYYSKSDPTLVTIKSFDSKKLRLIVESIQGVATLIFILPILVYSPTIIEHHFLRLTDSLQWVSANVLMIVPIFASIIFFHLIVRMLVLIIDD